MIFTQNDQCKRDKLNKNEPIIAPILKRPMQLKRQDFVNFTRIINSQDIGAIQIPFSNLLPLSADDNERIHVLTVFIYYIISVQLKLQIFINDKKSGQKYRSHCVKEISHYYLKNGLNIQLREFSFLCGVILEAKICHCAHILFYLIYGRYASQPFIKSLFRNFNNLNKINFKTSRKHIKSRTNSKIICNHSQELQIYEFYHELKNALNPNLRREMNKRSEIKEMLEFSQFQHFYESNYYSQTSKRKPIEYLSVGISKSQNSSIMQSLPFQKTQTTFRNIAKKSQMRKKNFTLKINQNLINQQIKSKKHIDFKNHQDKQLSIFPKNQKKIGVEKVKIIASQLRVQTSLLDEVREYCTLYKLASQREKWVTKNEQKQKPVNDGEQKASNPNQQQSSEQDQIELETNSNNSLKIQSLSGTISTLIPKQGIFSRFIRIEQTLHHLQTKEKPLHAFTSQPLSWANKNCKKRVQRFKDQYRRFISKQMLEKIKETQNGV